jgi:GNAT superfamily N-acetyltransferase
MVLVRETTLAEWEVLRDIRLEALQDSPDFFGSTYQDEKAITPTAWRASIARGGTFFAYPSGSTGVSPCGLVGGLHEVPDTVELVSLWVRPAARGQGVGQGLVRAVVDWARDHRAARVHLWLTKTNDQALLLYQRWGFALTGESQPLPSNPKLTEIGMARPLNHEAP